MNTVETTTAVTALANAIACELTINEVNLLGALLTQLGDTLIAIGAMRTICQERCEVCKQ